MGRNRWAVAALALGLHALQAQGQDASDMRYVSASSLNLRAAASATAEVLQRWRINQPVRVLEVSGRWCRVVAADGGPAGHVDCSFLVRAPVTRVQIETEAADAALALLRLAGDQGESSRSWTAQIERQAPELRRLAELLLQQAERHLALSPTLYTYRDVNALLRQLRDAIGDGNRPELAPLRDWASARIAALPALQAAFTADFAKDPREPLPGSVLGELAAVLERRQARAWGRLGDRPMPSTLAPSYFSQGRWAVGWAGGPLAQARKPVAGEGTPYAITFDGKDVAELAGVFEMAKQQRAAVKARFGVLKGEEHELTQALPHAGGGFETLRLDTRLTAWAVTERGLLPASIRSVSFSGGACSGETPDGTAAGVLLPQPPGGPLLAVFASSAPVDPAKARVTVQRRRFLAPLWDLFENTLTDRQTLTVDLDGDGVPDLRVLVSSDTAVGQLPPPLLRVGLQPVGGWYANDVYMLEANVDGRWRVLSRHAVVTCT